MQKTFALAAFALVATAGAAEARDQIRIVGSSTVFPFTSAVAERFAQAGQFPAPIVESTGTGGGMKEFCAGVGESTPDFTNASRRIKASEFEDCQANGVTQIVEVQVGFDGLSIAHSRAAAPLALTKAQVFQALAREVEVDGQVVANPYTSWDQIDPSLPAVEIEVLGPPPTSGTRDAFVELVMLEGCEEFPAIAALEGDQKTAACSTLREDGRYIEAGENDNLIVQRLEANQNAYGIFGYSFLEENADKLQGVSIDGVAPTYETILAGEYPVSRPLYIYAKAQHVGVIPGMAEFLAEYTSDRARGEDGYLADIGIVPLPEDLLAEMRNNVTNLVAMSAPQS